MANSLKELGNAILTRATNETKSRALGKAREIGGALSTKIRDTPLGSRLSAWGLLSLLDQRVQRADTAPDSMGSFIAALKQSSVASSNRFRVTFTFPAAVGIQSETLRTLTLMCEEAALPGRDVRTRSQRFNGLREHRAAGIDLHSDSINFQFILQNTMEPKVHIERWMDYMVDPFTRQVAFYKDYIADVTIEALDRNHDTIYTVTLQEAFPKAVHLIPLAYGNSAPMKLHVGFCFKRWTAEPANRPDIDVPMSNGPETFKDKLARQALGGLKDVAIRKVTEKLGGPLSRATQELFRRTR